MREYSVQQPQREEPSRLRPAQRKGKKNMTIGRTTRRATFRIVVDGDLDNPLPVTAIEEFPDFLAGYRESIFAQMVGEEYYKSQLVLRLREGGFVTYDFYSEQAWIDEMVETQVREKLEPYEQAEREDEMNMEIERRVQERMAEEQELRRARGADLASIYRVFDNVTQLPVYIGHTKKSVETRMQQHIAKALSPSSGEPRLHGFLSQRIQEKNFPTIQVVRQTLARSARREESAEIRSLILQGVPLFNIESVRVTTRARYSMGEIQFPIEGLESL